MTTTAFKALAKMEAKAKGLAEVEVHAVPHPLGAGQLPEMVRKKALDGMENLVKMMTGKK